MSLYLSLEIISLAACTPTVKPDSGETVSRCLPFEMIMGIVSDGQVVEKDKDSKIRKFYKLRLALRY